MCFSRGCAVRIKFGYGAIIYEVQAGGTRNRVRGGGGCNLTSHEASVELVLPILVVHVEVGLNV